MTKLALNTYGLIAFAPRQIGQLGHMEIRLCLPGELGVEAVGVVEAADLGAECRNLLRRAPHCDVAGRGEPFDRIPPWGDVLEDEPATRVGDGGRGEIEPAAPRIEHDGHALDRLGGMYEPGPERDVAGDPRRSDQERRAAGRSRSCSACRTRTRSSARLGRPSG